MVVASMGENDEELARRSVVGIWCTDVLPTVEVDASVRYEAIESMTCGWREALCSFDKNTMRSMTWAGEKGRREEELEGLPGWRRERYAGCARKERTGQEGGRNNAWMALRNTRHVAAAAACLKGDMALHDRRAFV